MFGISCKNKRVVTVVEFDCHRVVIAVVLVSSLRRENCEISGAEAKLSPDFWMLDSQFLSRNRVHERAIEF